MGPLFGIPVSGFTVPATIATTRETGPDEWTGGTFGIEAGITALLLMMLSIAASLAWARWREGRVRLVTELLDPAGPA